MSLSRSGRLEPEFLSSQLQCLILGTFQSRKTTKNQKKKKKATISALEDHGKNLISAMICKWEVSQPSNFP